MRQPFSPSDTSSPDSSSGSCRVFAVLPAAGSSTRMGSACPKVLLPLGSRTVLEWSLATIGDIPQLAGVIVPVPANSISEFENKTKRSLEAPVAFVAGGSTRQDSVRLSLAALKERFSPLASDIVIVHDAARCLATADLFQKTLQAAREHGAAVAALPIVDTLKTVSNGTIVGSVDRSTTWAMQTPQIFSWELLRRAHSSNQSGATDDASLVQDIAPVAIVEGERTNIKLTTPDDFELAKKLKKVEA